MAKNNMKLGRDVFDYIHMMRLKNPNLSGPDLATSCKGKFGISISNASVYVALRFSSYEELEKFRETQWQRKKHTVFKQEQVAEQPEQIEILNEVEEEQTIPSEPVHEEQTSEESGADSSADKAVMNQFINNTETSHGIIASLLQTTLNNLNMLLVAKGTNGYPDETIANKVSGIAAGCATIKKEIKTGVDVLLDSEQCVLGSVASIEKDVSCMKLELEKNTSEIRKTNELLEKLIYIWEPDYNCAEM